MMLQDSLAVEGGSAFFVEALVASVLLQVPTGRLPTCPVSKP